MIRPTGECIRTDAKNHIAGLNSRLGRRRVLPNFANFDTGRRRNAALTNDMPEDEIGSGVDISPLHRELDRLKSQLCRCQHQGTCMACRGFEMLREQSQMVVAAASQPVLMKNPANTVEVSIESVGTLENVFTQSARA